MARGAGQEGVIVAMNHQFNARLHKLPPCPECNAFESCACTNPNGFVRGPHAVRIKIKEGDLVVVRTQDARAARKLRALRTLVTAIQVAGGG